LLALLEHVFTFCVLVDPSCSCSFASSSKGIGAKLLQRQKQKRRADAMIASAGAAEDGAAASASSGDAAVASAAVASPPAKKKKVWSKKAKPKVVAVAEAEEIEFLAHNLTRGTLGRKLLHQELNKLLALDKELRETLSSVGALVSRIVATQDHNT
jgi:hypothetical protein